MFVVNIISVCESDFSLWGLLFGEVEAVTDRTEVGGEFPALVSAQVFSLFLCSHSSHKYPFLLAILSLFYFYGTHSLFSGWSA